MKKLNNAFFSTMLFVIYTVWGLWFVLTKGVKIIQEHVDMGYTEEEAKEILGGAFAQKILQFHLWYVDKFEPSPDLKGIETDYPIMVFPVSFI